MILLLCAFLTVSGVFATPINPDYDDEINLQAPPGFHYIPTYFGGFELMSEDEINNYEDPEARKYDAYLDMQFYLHTNKNGQVPERISIDDAEALQKSSFDKNLPTRLMIHGWGDNGVDGGAVMILKDSYLDLGDYNYFAVDWSKGSDTPNYISARNRANSTGTVMGKFIEFLVRDGGISLDNVRIAGFSLGGQVVGYTGKYLKGQLPVIYGIDPAGPLFFENSTDRLTYDDAKYVEVIHTNGQKLGHDRPLGHVDFYPNGGRSQPGCKWDLTGNCAHSRALYFFAESLNGERGFLSTRCNSREDITETGCLNGDGTTRLMGRDPPENEVVQERQVYWLRTNDKQPFALGTAGIE